MNKKNKENILMDEILSGLNDIKLDEPNIKPDIVKIVKCATENFTKILSTDEIKTKYNDLYWGGNGLGNRWANKKFNYASIYGNHTIKKYTEDDCNIPQDILDKFLNLYEKNKKGIIGIFVFSERIVKNDDRPTSDSIKSIIRNMPCVNCAATSDIVCDHKNDLYNDERVLNTKTQLLSDFQPLCNACNLQKREICKKEKETGKLYSGKNIPALSHYQFDFPWEKKIFDINDINCKKDTYWYDPLEFHNKCLMTYLLQNIKI